LEKFSFWGFLPVKSGRRRAVLETIKAEGKTAVVFESPYRIGKALDDICEYIGPDVTLAIVREATKIHEEVIRGTAAEIKKASQGRNWKGEFVIVISRTDSALENDNESVQLELE
jgi:16S rRNA (cytidine1402-2'-O)-methyltransferase